MAKGNKCLENDLKPVLREAGFKKLRSTWFYDAEETILVLNLQKSMFGDKYYINLGIYIKGVDDVKIPYENKCHIRERLAQFVSNNESDLDYLLDMTDTKIPYEQKLSGIIELIKTHGLPFLISLKSKDDIIRHINENKLPKLFITLNAKISLGLCCALDSKPRDGGCRKNKPQAIAKRFVLKQSRSR